MAVLVFSNLNFTSPTDRVVDAEQVYEVFVVDFYERAFDGIVPRPGALLLDLPATRKEGGDCARDDAHAVVGIRGVGVEVYSSHGVRLPAARLAVRKNRAIEAFNETRDKRLGGGCKHGMLVRGRAVHLVESENLFLRSCARGSRRGSRWAGIRRTARCGFNANRRGRGCMKNRTLEASGNIGVILGRWWPDANS